MSQVSHSAHFVLQTELSTEGNGQKREEDQKAIEKKRKRQKTRNKTTPLAKCFAYMSLKE